MHSLRWLPALVDRWSRCYRPYRWTDGSICSWRDPEWRWLAPRDSTRDWSGAASAIAPPASTSSGILPRYLFAFRTQAAGSLLDQDDDLGRDKAEIISFHSPSSSQFRSATDPISSPIRDIIMSSGTKLPLSMYVFTSLPRTANETFVWGRFANRRCQRSSTCLLELWIILYNRENFVVLKVSCYERVFLKLTDRQTYNLSSTEWRIETNAEI